MLHGRRQQPESFREDFGRNWLAYCSSAARWGMRRLSRDFRTWQIFLMISRSGSVLAKVRRAYEEPTAVG